MADKEEHIFMMLICLHERVNIYITRYTNNTEFQHLNLGNVPF